MQVGNYTKHKLALKLVNRPAAGSANWATVISDCN